MVRSGAADGRAVDADSLIKKIGVQMCRDSVNEPGGMDSILVAISWLLRTFDTDVKIARPIVIRGGEHHS
jgi:hypothetical protein